MAHSQHDARNGNGHSATALKPLQGAAPAATILETTVNPFHCLYQDALHYHTQSKIALGRSESEASRHARVAFLLYLSSAEALVHQAAIELGRPELAPLLADPSRPLPLSDAWRLLPAIVAEGPAANVRFDPTSPPWPQFAELLALRASWAYPGPAQQRRAYYAGDGSSNYEPIEPRDLPAGLGIAPDRVQLPRTGLPRDPYALRPHHLDAAKGILDAAIAALDKRLDGALTRDQRHRKEPVRLINPGA